MKKNNPNSYQVAGAHYQKYKYQTWDFITDIHADYLMGCVIKYLSRFEDKNGMEDLKKSDHYWRKYCTIDRMAPKKTNLYSDHDRAFLIDKYTAKYANQFKDGHRQLISTTVYAYLEYDSDELDENMIISGCRQWLKITLD